jgi:hypothetical protein
VNGADGRGRHLALAEPREGHPTCQPAGQHTVKRHNRSLVLSRIAGAPGQSRAQVAHATGLTRATVSTLVDELIGSQLIIELTPALARGRPASPLQLNPEGPAAIGIEINGVWLLSDDGPGVGIETLLVLLHVECPVLIEVA